MLKVFVTAFDKSQEPVTDMTSSDGLSFNLTRMCLMVCNHRILKNEKVYFEMEITDFNRQSNMVHIPIFVGVHKDPAGGNLVNDCSFGSIYYPAGGDYIIHENNRMVPGFVDSVPATITAPTIIPNDIIGIAIDAPANEVTIYNNGVCLYTWKPSTFDMSTDTEGFYAAIYSRLSGVDIQGNLNFGRYGTKYCPTGFKTMLDQHNSYPIPVQDCRFDPIVVPKKNNGDLWVEQTYAVGNVGPIPGDTDPCNFEIDNVDGSFAVVNRPIPVDYQIYTEFRVRNATNSYKIVGIPMSFGLSTTNYDITTCSIRIPLWHRANIFYKWYHTTAGVETEENVYSVCTSVPNQGGDVVGFFVDLKAKIIRVWVNKVFFMEYPIPNLPTPTPPMYLFFSYDKSYKSSHADVYLNLGQDQKNGTGLGNVFKDTIPYHAMSLWYYYNRLFLIKAPDTDMDCQFYVFQSNHHMAYDVPICEFDVLWNPDIIETYPDQENVKYFSHGINRIMKTFNIVHDDEPHTKDDEARYIPLLEYLRFVGDHNWGYYPDKPLGADKRHFDIQICAQFNVTK